MSHILVAARPLPIPGSANYLEAVHQFPVLSEEMRRAGRPTRATGTTPRSGTINETCANSCHIRPGAHWRAALVTRRTSSIAGADRVDRHEKMEPVWSAGTSTNRKRCYLELKSRNMTWFKSSPRHHFEDHCGGLPNSAANGTEPWAIRRLASVDE